jgi:hypothetical protein
MPWIRKNVRVLVFIKTWIPARVSSWTRMQKNVLKGWGGREWVREARGVIGPDEYEIDIPANG